MYIKTGASADALFFFLRKIGSVGQMNCRPRWQENILSWSWALYSPWV